MRENLEKCGKTYEWMHNTGWTLSSLFRLLQLLLLYRQHNDDVGRFDADSNAAYVDHYDDVADVAIASICKCQ